MKYEEVERVVMDELITKTEAIEAVTQWLEIHPQGCGYCMSPRETAEFIFEEYTKPIEDE